MDGLGIVILILILVVAAVVAIPRLMRRNGDGGPSIGRAGRARGETTMAPASIANPDDPDNADEASHLLSAIGGEVRPGDAVSLTIDDPARWQINQFELDLSVAAVSRAEIRDTTGLFSFWLYWMSPGQEAGVVIVEGDSPALAEAFVGRQVADDSLLGTLRWCRQRYADEREHDRLDFDLSEHELGQWTAISLREGGQLIVTAGQVDLLPAGATIGGGLPYRDFTLVQGEGVSLAQLRLVEVGTYSYLYLGERHPLRNVRFMRQHSR